MLRSYHLASHVPCLSRCHSMSHRPHLPRSKQVCSQRLPAHSKISKKAMVPNQRSSRVSTPLSTRLSHLNKTLIIVPPLPNSSRSKAPHSSLPLPITRSTLPNSHRPKRRKQSNIFNNNTNLLHTLSFITRNLYRLPTLMRHLPRPQRPHKTT